MAEELCIQVQLKEGGTNYIKHGKTTYVAFSEKSHDVAISGIGSICGNSTVLEALVACSNSGSIATDYTPIEGGDAKMLQVPLSTLNLQATRAVQIDGLMLLAMPMHAQCDFKSNEMKERAALAVASAKLGIASASRIGQKENVAIALRLSAMDAAELEVQCAAENMAVYFETMPESTLTNFAFFMPANATMPRMETEGTTVSFFLEQPLALPMPGTKQLSSMNVTHRVIAIVFSVFLLIAGIAFVTIITTAEN